MRRADLSVAGMWAELRGRAGRIEVLRRPSGVNVAGARYRRFVSPSPGLPPVELLRTFILRCIQSPTNRENYKLPPGRRPEFLLLIGICLRVRRFAQAYNRLERGGFSVEGRVLIRSALEHAVTAQYAHLVIGGMERLAVSGTRDQYGLAKFLAEFSSDPTVPDLVEQFAAARLDGKGLPRFSGKDSIIEELDNEAFLRTTYKVLSLVAHPSHQTTFDILDIDDDDVSVKLEPTDHYAHQMFYSLAAACMLVAWLIAHLIDDEAEMATLRDLANQLHMPWRLDGGLPDERRRFPLD